MEVQILSPLPPKIDRTRIPSGILVLSFPGGFARRGHTARQDKANQLILRR